MSFLRPLGLNGRRNGQPSAYVDLNHISNAPGIETPGAYKPYYPEGDGGGGSNTLIRYYTHMIRNNKGYCMVLYSRRSATALYKGVGYGLLCSDSTKSLSKPWVIMETKWLNLCDLGEGGKLT